MGVAKSCLILLASKAADIQPFFDSEQVANVECLQFAARDTHGGLGTASTGAKSDERSLDLPAISLVLIPHDNKACSRIPRSLFGNCFSRSCFPSNTMKRG
jgi:hypothetical protein